MHLYNGEASAIRFGLRIFQEKLERKAAKHFEKRLGKTVTAPNELKDYRGAKGWTQRSWWATLLHNDCEGYSEIKFTHEDGREVILDGVTGNLVTDPKFGGTYNYSNSFGEHFTDDMVPFFLWGNIRGSEGDYGLWDFICPFINGSYWPSPFQ